MKLLRMFILIDKGTIQPPLSLQEGLNETTECSNKFVFCDMSVTSGYFLKIQYLDRGTCF